MLRHHELAILDVNRAQFQRLQQDPLNYLKARDYLVTENYYGPLEKILASLDGSLVPQTAPRVKGSPTFVLASLATMAFIESADVFRIIFHLDPSSATPSEAATYAKRCTEMILDKWEDIAKWMSYLVVHDTEGITTVDIGNDASPWSAVKCITEAILLLFRSNSNELGIALVSRPCTVTLLVLLLAKVQLGTRKYLLLHLPGSASRCITTDILHISWARCKAGQDSAVVALVTRSRRWRHTVFTALACRATQLAEETVGKDFDVAYAVTLERLVEVVTTLSLRLGEWIYRTNVFSELAAAVDSVAQKAHLAEVVDQRCWELLSMTLIHLVWAAVESSQNPLAILPQLVRSGLLRAALICSRRRGTHTSRPKSPFDVDSLYFLVPYLQFESIYSAAEECGGLRDIIDRSTLNASTGYTEPPIWGIVLDERDRSWGTYSSEKRGPFCLCSNVKVRRLRSSQGASASLNHT